MKIGVALPTGEGDSGGGMPSYAFLRSIAQRVEGGGLDSIWIADHLIMRFPDTPEAGVHEAWTMLAALAEATERVELGTIVLCTSFRNPGLVAKMAVALDDISGGRLILGLGCGWHDPEYEAFGYSTDHKVGRFEEALEIIRRLLAGERVTFDGRWSQVTDAVLKPPPARDIPLLVAARRPRMLDLTARHAQLWNTAWFGAPDERLTERRSEFAAALATAGRAPATIEETVGVRMRPAGTPAPDGEGRGAVFQGSATELADVLDAYAKLGFGHLIAWPDPTTDDALEWLVEGVELHRSRAAR